MPALQQYLSLAEELSGEVTLRSTCSAQPLFTAESIESRRRSADLLPAISAG